MPCLASILDQDRTRAKIVVQIELTCQALGELDHTIPLPLRDRGFFWLGLPVGGESFPIKRLESFQPQRRDELFDFDPGVSEGPLKHPVDKAVE